MDHIRVIQEIVDANKEDIPTGITARVMKQCQKAYNAYNKFPELYGTSLRGRWWIRTLTSIM